MKHERNRDVKLVFWFCAVGCACITLSGCPEGDNTPRKPDPTKGTVTGLVLCTDTGKPRALP